MADRVDLATYKAAPSKPLPGQKRTSKKPAAPAFRHRVMTK